MELERERRQAEEGVRDAGELDVEDAFGEHDIEYWVRRDNKLIPATAEEIAQIRERERERTAYLRLACLNETQQRADCWPARVHRYLSAIHPRRMRRSQDMPHADARASEESVRAKRDAPR